MSPKGRAGYGAARPSAWRRSASGHAFAIVSRIARCSLPLLARFLRASRSSADPSRLVTCPPASVMVSAPTATSHGRARALAPYRNLTALAMEQRAARARFGALLLDAERYLDAGGDLASLSPSMRSNSACCRRDGSAEHFLAPAIPIRFFTPGACSAPPRQAASRWESKAAAMRIADGSSFRYLPAKGLTLILISNARRVGSNMSRGLTQR